MKMCLFHHLRRLWREYFNGLERNEWGCKSKPWSDGAILRASQNVTYGSTTTTTTKVSKPLKIPLPPLPRFYGSKESLLSRIYLFFVPSSLLNACSKVAEYKIYVPGSRISSSVKISFTSVSGLATLATTENAIFYFLCRKVTAAADSEILVISLLFGRPTDLPN